eukprot:TRINITY_DN10820_c0_g1_i5.p1 TRINITY_DN10820_c0_g1~~TRINITY_DN10820_c0_g1_i5.p1  ORF type:complete len:288 (+),score=19.40 TRINITY_DN10820_c0_g1_i5:224-1087(+)
MKAFYSMLPIRGCRFGSTHRKDKYSAKVRSDIPGPGTYNVQSSASKALSVLVDNGAEDSGSNEGTRFVQVGQCRRLSGSEEQESGTMRLQCVLLYQSSWEVLQLAHEELASTKLWPRPVQKPFPCSFCSSIGRPTAKSEGPGPGTYKTANGISGHGSYFLSTVPSSRAARFGREPRVSRTRQRPKTPGPGSYRIPSDFGGVQSGRGQMRTAGACKRVYVLPTAGEGNGKKTRVKHRAARNRVRLNLSNLLCDYNLSLIHISEPTRLLSISYAVFCLKKKKKKKKKTK